MENQENQPTIPDSGKSTAVAEKEAPATPERKSRSEKTTSQRLFRDLEGSKVPGAGLFSEPVQKEEPPKKQDPVAAEEPKPEPKQELKYLNPEDFKGSKLKLKVDGVEEEATLEDVIRRAQLDSHLTKKGQRLSEEERRIKAKEMALVEQERLLKEMFSESKPKEAKADEESIVKDDPYVKRIENEIKQMRDAFQSLQVQTQPMVLEAAIKRVASQVKESLGLDDFTSYTGRIGEYLKGLPPDQARSIDNEAGWLAIYKELKLQELMKQSSAPKEEAKPASERPALKVVPVESGKSVSTGVNDDRASKIRALFDRARKLSSDGSPDRHAAWEEYLKSREEGWEQ